MRRPFVYCDLNPDEYWTVKQFAEQFFYSYDVILSKINAGYVNAIKKKGIWYIPKDPNLTKVGFRTIPERIFENGDSWLLGEKYAAQHGLSKNQMHYLIANGKLPMIRKHNRRYVPEDFIVTYIKPRRNGIKLGKLLKLQNNNRIATSV